MNREEWRRRALSSQIEIGIKQEERIKQLEAAIRKHKKCTDAGITSSELVDKELHSVLKETS